MTASRWAVILCKFSDDNSPTQPLTKYQRLFTAVGNGSLNMVDFFKEMSHGQLDLGSSQVFGWFTTTVKKSDYGVSVDRNALVAACRTAATNGGVNLASFDGVVVSMNGGVDLFGYIGGMEAFCDSNSLSPSPLGQEMGHGYGLDHARQDGSTADYQDPWDVMSVYASYMAANTDWGTIGPGLNACCMRSRGWLDEARVWTQSSPTIDEVVHLRPLHRHDLPGFLAANLGPYVVEYRPKERWDAAFPRSAVFVHRFEANHSYVMPGTNGNFDLVAGDVFQRGDPLVVLTQYLRAEITSIDDATHTATLHLQTRPSQRVRLPELVGEIFGGVAVDGGGWIFIGGKFHPVPPRGPETEIVQQIAAYMGVEEITDVNAQAIAQRAALSAISSVIARRTSQLQPFRSPTRNKIANVGRTLSAGKNKRTK